MDRVAKSVEQKNAAEKIWTVAFIRALKRHSHRKAARKADRAVSDFDQRWGR